MNEPTTIPRVSELLTEPELITSDVNVSTEDVVAIAMDHIERQTTAEIEKLSQQLQKARKNAERIQEAARKLHQGCAELACKKDRAAFEAAARAVGVKRFTVQFETQCDCDRVTGRGLVRISLSSQVAEYKNPPLHFGFTRPFRASKELLELYKEDKQVAEEINDIQKSIFAWKEWQSRSPQHERTFRAEIARVKLSESTSGQQLVKRLIDKAREDSESVGRRRLLAPVS